MLKPGVSTAQVWAHNGAANAKAIRSREARKGLRLGGAGGPRGYPACQLISSQLPGNLIITMLTPGGTTSGFPPTRECRRARKWYPPDPGGRSAAPENGKASCRA